MVKVFHEEYDYNRVCSTCTRVMYFYGMLWLLKTQELKRGIDLSYRSINCLPRFYAADQPYAYCADSWVPHYVTSTISPILPPEGQLG